MNRVFIFGIILLLFSGCVPDEPIQHTTQSSRSASSYRGELARRTHPLSNIHLFPTAEIQPVQKIASKPPPEIIAGIPKRSIRRNPFVLQSLSKLQSSYPDLDLNESINQKFLLAYLKNEPFQSIITLSQERYFHLQLDNDIFNYTDRFYTNGIHLAFITPGLSQNPIGRLLVPYWYRGINYYGISLVQNMYTPSTTKIGGILEGDRPYASYLYIGSSKITNDAAHKIRLSSEIQIGVIGPASLGEYVQRTFHNAVPTNNEPLGWEFQIRNDLLLNYNVRMEKGVVSIRGLDFLLHGAGSLGTVYTNIEAGAYVRSGWFNSYFMNLYFSKRSLNRKRNARNFQFYFLADCSAKAVGYDATLQGGLFNQTSPYTIPAEDINRLMFVGSAGIVVSYGGIQLKGEQFLLSPEFENGWWHKWLSIGLTFSF